MINKITYEEVRDAFKIINKVYKKKFYDNKLAIVKQSNLDSIEYLINFESGYGRVQIKLEETKMATPFMLNLFGLKTVAIYALDYLGADQSFKFNHAFSNTNQFAFDNCNDIVAAWREFYYYLITGYILCGSKIR